MTKPKKHLYQASAAIPYEGGIKEIITMVVTSHEDMAKIQLLTLLDFDQLNYVRINPGQIKVNVISDERLAYWCKEVLGVEA